MNNTTFSMNDVTFTTVKQIFEQQYIFDISKETEGIFRDLKLIRERDTPYFYAKYTNPTSERYSVVIKPKQRFINLVKKKPEVLSPKAIAIVLEKEFDYIKKMLMEIR